MEKKPRIRKFAGYIKIKSPVAGTVTFEDLVAVECPGVVDNLNLFMDMIAEEHKCLMKDREMLKKMIKKKQMIDPKKIYIMVETLILAKEKMYKIAMGKEEGIEKKE